MSKYRLLAIVPIALTVIACVSNMAVSSHHLGGWQAVSKVLYSVYGDLEVNKDKLSFTILGDFEYRVKQTEKDYVIIETNNIVDCGSIIKLGPFKDKDMEFSVYNEVYSEDELCSWGVYVSQM